MHICGYSSFFAYFNWIYKRISADIGMDWYKKLDFFIFGLNRRLVRNLIMYFCNAYYLKAKNLLQNGPLVAVDVCGCIKITYDRSLKYLDQCLFGSIGSKLVQNLQSLGHGIQK